MDLSDLFPGISGGLPWSVISGNTNAAAMNGYLIDASGGNVTLTLPASPSTGDTVAACDYTNSATTNTITIARNGNNIEGSATDLTIDINGAGFTLVYADATRGWEIVSEASGAAGVADRCRIKTGTYTGDGTTGQAITGVGFQPKYVRIWKHLTAEAAQNATEKLDQSWADYCIFEGQTTFYAYDNLMNSLDSDGFTVDDAGSDSFPNGNGVAYDYLALG
jgi:hypothetical protein